MKLEQQVCSLDLAKRLKELGMKQESYFYWLHSEFTFPLGNTAQNWFINAGQLYNQDPYEEITKTISAFTVAELGEMLPVNFSGIKGSQTFTVRWFTDTNPLRDGKPNSFYESANTEADARAMCLIYLLENKLL